MPEAQTYIKKHYKTLKIEKIGVCRLPTGGVFTSHRGGGRKKITGCLSIT